MHVCTACGTTIAHKHPNAKYCDACRGPEHVRRQREARMRAAASRPRIDPRVERLSEAVARGEVGWDRIMAIRGDAARQRLLEDATQFMDTALSMHREEV